MNFFIGQIRQLFYPGLLNKHKINKTYVQQLLIQIPEFISDFEKFKLVSSKLNPADLGTKTLSPKEVFSNK